MKNPSYTYENVQIGNFLIALGYSLRDRGESLNGSINLFQQTPDDREIGDIFGGLGGKYFILEFKRDGDHVSKELDKEARRLLVEKIDFGKNPSYHISLKSHLMIYASWNENNQLNYETQPYLRGIGVEIAQISKNPFERIKSPSQFIEQIYSKTSVLGCSIKEMEQYVELLQSCIPTSGGSSNGGRSISGLVMHADPDKGEIQSFSFQNLDQLHLVILQSMEINKQKRLKLAQKLEQQRKEEQKINRSKGQSNGIGMGGI